MCNHETTAIDATGCGDSKMPHLEAPILDSTSRADYGKCFSRSYALGHGRIYGLNHLLLLTKKADSEVAGKKPASRYVR